MVSAIVFSWFANFEKKTPLLKGHYHQHVPANGECPGCPCEEAIVREKAGAFSSPWSRKLAIKTSCVSILLSSSIRLFLHVDPVKLINILISIALCICKVPVLLLSALCD